MEIKLGKRYPKSLDAGSAIWYLKACPAIRISRIGLPGRVRFLPADWPQWQAVYYPQLSSGKENPLWVQRLIETGRVAASGKVVHLLPGSKFQTLAELKEALGQASAAQPEGALSDLL